MLALEQQVPATEVALSNIMATKQFKLFVAVPDGELWRWRVTWPYNRGKCGMTSKESFPTRQAAEWAAHVISNFERPSAVMVGAFANVPASAGQPAEMREEHVGV
jgi:hypothetical protein